MPRRPFGPALLALIALIAIRAASAVPPPSHPSAAAPTREPGEAESPAKPASRAFDPVAATDAYLASLPKEQRARTDAYYEGGYWLLLWDFLAGAAVSLVLLSTRASARMRDLAERIARRRPLQTCLYWAQYLIVTSVVLFPLTIYEGYVREHRYGLANQTFGPWMGDQIKGFLVNLVFGAIAMIILYGVLRRAARNWWLWGSLAVVAVLIFAILVAPVYVTPLFNTYKKLEDPKVRDPILSLARANGITVREVYEFDASRQSKRMSANVTGFLGTERISMNDNLLRRGSLPEIEAVMGHEMGHYVLHHVYHGIAGIGLMIVVGFAFVQWSFEKVRARRGERWGIASVGDLAGLPLFVLLISTYFFAITPVFNSFIRTQEAEADMFGLNAAAQPDGMAQAALHVGEYRKLEPGRLEEILFFDHPSGRNRILTAMKWKAEHLK